jgi:hypothetical protein
MTYVMAHFTLFLFKFKGAQISVIHHQLSDGRVFRTFGTHSMSS